MHHIGDKKNTMEGVMHIITYGRIHSTSRWMVIYKYQNKLARRENPQLKMTLFGNARVRLAKKCSLRFAVSANAYSAHLPICAGLAVLRTITLCEESLKHPLSGGQELTRAPHFLRFVWTVDEAPTKPSGQVQKFLAFSTGALAAGDQGHTHQ